MRATSSTGRRRLTAAILAPLIAATFALTGCAEMLGGSGETLQRSIGGAPAGGAAVAPLPGATDQATVSEASQGSAGGSTVPAAKLVVVTKNLEITVDDTNAAVAKIRTLVTAAAGDITSLQISTTNGGPVQPVEGGGAPAASTAGPFTASLVVRVPAAKYAGFVDALVKLGNVTNQSETNEDVTQQHIDLKARLKNLLVEEARLRGFMNKAKNVRDALAVEAQLSRVRGDIEAMQAQVDYLERQAAMATVNITLSEPESLVQPAGQTWGVADAIRTGIRGFVWVFNVIVVVVMSTAVIWIPAAIVGWLLVRRSRRRRAAAAAAGETLPPPGPSDEKAADEFYAERGKTEE